MTPPVLSAVYAALCALWFLGLTYRVIRLRLRFKVAHGDGGEKLLIRAIRGQANAAEQLPIALILLVLAEMLGAPAVAIHVIGVALLAGRIIHGLHFARVIGHNWRPVGMGLTLLSTTVLALGILAHALIGAG